MLSGRIHPRGRYWSMWTTKGTWDCTFTNTPGSCGVRAGELQVSL